MPEEAGAFRIYGPDKLPTSRNGSSHDSLQGKDSTQGRCAVILASTAHFLHLGRLVPTTWEDVIVVSVPQHRCGSGELSGELLKEFKGIWKQNTLSQLGMPRPASSGMSPRCSCPHVGSCSQPAKLGCPCWRHLSSLLVHSRKYCSRGTEPDHRKARATSPTWRGRCL